MTIQEQNIMPAFDVIAAFFGASLLLALAPGPDNIFVLTQSALFGVKAGIMTILGLLSGVLVHTCLVAFGVAIIFQTSALAFTLLKCCGAAYLCWLAWQAFRAGSHKLQNDAKQSFMGYGALYRRGIIMNVTNPKVALFFLALLPQFCNPASGPMWLQIFCLGICFILAAAIIFCPVAFLGGKLAAKFNNSPRSQILLNRIAGVVFLCMALSLALTSQ